MEPLELQRDDMPFVGDADDPDVVDTPAVSLRTFLSQPEDLFSTPPTRGA